MAPESSNSTRWFWLLLGPAVFLGILFFVDFSKYSELLSVELNALHVSVVAGLLAWMFIWWVGECLPLGITALLPLLVLPSFEVLTLKQTTVHYSSEVIFLFLGGFILSIALERVGLHIQLAQWVLRFFGRKPAYLLLGFMVSVALLSLWISNTATALIMLPVALGLKDQLYKLSPRYFISLLLGIAHSSSIGGIASLISTPPNAIYAQFMQTQLDQTVTFIGWMTKSLPLSVVTLLLCWLFLSYMGKAWKLQKQGLLVEIGDSFSSAANKLASTKDSTKKYVTLIFLLMVLLWIINPFITFVKISDAQVSIIGILLLFSIPNFLKVGDLSKVHWNILLLFGGGLALAQGIGDSGFAKVIVHYATYLLPETTAPLLVAFILISMVVIFTEILSNTACTALFLPLLLPLSQSFNLDSSALLLAVTYAASLSFMMPIATPPNALVYSTQLIPIKTMLKWGLCLNILMAVLITLHYFFNSL